MPKRLKELLKLLISVLLIYLVLRHIDREQLQTILRHSHPLWLFVAFILFNLSKVLSALRLNFYFKDCGLSLRERHNLILYYVGMFYNLFLPGGIGGDGYKVYLLNRRYGCSAKLLIQASLLDRISGLAALLFLGGLLFAWSDYAALYPSLLPLDIAALFLLYPALWLIHRFWFPRFAGSLLATSLLGLGVQLLQLLCAYALILALPVAVPVIDFLTLFLLSSVLAVLPLTVGGVGIREFTFLYGLKLLGHDPSAGVAFGLLFFLITLLSSALGLLFLHRPLPKEY